MTTGSTRLIKGILFGVALLVLVLATKGVAAQVAPQGRPPIGIQPVWPGQLVVVRILVGLFAVLMLVVGSRLRQLTAGTFFLAVSLLVSGFMLGPYGYPLAILGAVVAFAILSSIYAFVPRLGGALLAFWPLLVLAVAYRILVGSLPGGILIGVVLLLAGIAVGAIFPRGSLIMVAPAIGSLLLAIVWPGEPGFWNATVLFAVGMIWQGLGMRLFIPSLPDWPVTGQERIQKARAQVVKAIRWAAIVLVTGFVAAAFFVPQPSPNTPGREKRLAALRASGALVRPGLIFSSENNFYLFGTPHPAVLVADSPSFWSRLKVLVLGRSPGKEIANLRAVKDVEEIATIRRACEITSEAIGVAHQMVQPGMNEAKIEMAILAVFRSRGAEGIAFVPIIASGAHALIPHYEDNNDVLSDGFIIMDIGCTYQGYASDLTRTFPVRGVMTKAQAKVYGATLAAKQAAEVLLKPGVSMRDLNQAANKVIGDAGFGDYILHSVGHHLGVDVHDTVVSMRGGAALTEGNVITIEPGIYIPRGAKIDPAYWDLGVRLEDTYVVTRDGYQVLTNYPMLAVAKESTSP